MFCIKCGKENKDGMKFCVQCGSELNGDNIKNSEMNVDNINKNDEYVNNVSYENNNVKKSDHTSLIVVIVIAVIAIIIGVSAVILWKVNSKKVSDNEVNSNNVIDIDTNNNVPNINNEKTNKNNIDNTKNSVNNTDNNNNNNVDKVVNNSNNVDNSIKFDNYNVDVSMTMELSGMDVEAKITGTVDEKNQVEYLKMTMDMYGMSFTSETYSDLKNGITYNSEPLTGSWTKTTGASQIIDLNDLLTSLKSMKNVSKIDDNHFKVKITSNDIMGMLDDAYIDFNDITGEILADVYTNNGYIEKIIYDFSNITEEFSEFSMEMEISNYNGAGSVSIPEDVIRSATEF